MKYERLTDKKWKEIEKHCYAKGLHFSNHFTEEETDEMIKRLAELEDKIESGKLVELPCKIGDTLYGISAPLHIEKAKLSEVCYEVVTKDGHYLIGHFGISLFTDKSQAEARLKELEGGL